MASSFLITLELVKILFLGTAATICDKVIQKKSWAVFFIERIIRTIPDEELERNQAGWDWLWLWLANVHKELGNDVKANEARRRAEHLRKIREHRESRQKYN